MSLKDKMSFEFHMRMEEYYQRFVELQEKLRKSEEERLKLELKFNEMQQIAKEEEQMHFRKLRTHYKKFLEEDWKRQERNEKIIRNLERIETKIAMLSAKTERLNILRKHYQSYLWMAQNSNDEHNKSIIEPLPQTPSINVTQATKSMLISKNDHLEIPIFDKFSVDLPLSDRSKVEKMQILEKYLDNLKNQRFEDDHNEAKLENNQPFYKHVDRPFGKTESKSFHRSTDIADEIMNSIQSRYYDKGDDISSKTVPLQQDPETEKLLKSSLLIEKEKSDNFNLTNGIRDTLPLQSVESEVNDERNLHKPEEKITFQDVSQQINLFSEDNQKNEILKQIAAEENKVVASIPQIQDYSKKGEVVEPSKEESSSTETKNETDFHVAELYQHIDNSNTTAQNFIETDLDEKNTPACSENTNIVEYNDNPQISSEVALINQEQLDQVELQQFENNESSIQSMINQEPTNFEVSIDHKIPQNKNSEINIPPVSQEPAINTDDDVALQEYNIRNEQPNEYIAEASYDQEQVYNEVAEPDDSAVNIQVSHPMVEDPNNVDSQQEYYDENNQYPSQEGHDLQNEVYQEGQEQVQYDYSQYDEYGQCLLYDHHGQSVQPEYDEQGQIVPRYDENGELIVLYDHQGQQMYPYPSEVQYDPSQYQYSNNNKEYNENDEIAQPNYNDEPNYDLSNYDQQYYNNDQTALSENQEHLNEPDGKLDDNQQSFNGDKNHEFAEEMNEEKKLSSQDNILTENKLNSPEKSNDRDDNINSKLEILDTDTESSIKQNISKVSNDSDFDFN